jgi:4-hydroxybenzoate polyprenyltransferase
MSLLVLYLKTSRPLFWVPGPLAFCSGVIFNRAGQVSDFFNPVILLQMVSLSLPLTLFTFGINDIFDQATDALNPRKKASKKGLALLEGGGADPKDHPPIIKGVLAGGLMILLVSVLSFNSANLFYTVSLLVISFAYSAPPWRLKARPPLDSITAGLGFSLFPFAMGYSHMGNPWNIPFVIYLFSLCAMGIHAFTTIMDYTPDQKSHIPTFAVRYGKRAAALFAAATLLPALAAAKTGLVMVFLVVCTLIFLLCAAFPSEKRVRTASIFIYTAGVVFGILWLVLNL